MQELLDKVARVAVQAGEIALACSKEARVKADGSPITQADLEANAFITQALMQISPYQVCSEEAVLGYEARKDLEYFWLVDPLDGTKDFAANLSGWSINIALIHHSKPILGVVYAPALKELYVGLEGFGARSYEVDSTTLQRFRLESGVRLCGDISARVKQADSELESSLLACDSVFHSSALTQEFIAHYGLESIKLGSSLKFCALARGEADIYPRFNGTKEWDTAASQVIVEQSGGAVISVQTGKPLSYNKKHFANDYFVAFSANQVGGAIYEDVRSDKLPLALKASYYGLVVWLTGLAGSGKSTICKELYIRLRDAGLSVVYLDGDELRDVLGAYSYDKQGRISVAKKRADLARLLSRQGVITIVSTISMFDEIYQYNREHFPNYLEVYISCAYEELIRRDQKQLYSKALKGELPNVVGVDIDYDEPKAHLQIDNTTLGGIDEKVGQILAAIQSK